MWLYPLPALVALVGWIYVAATPDQRQNLGTALILLILGLAAYYLRARAVKIWPFAQSNTPLAPTPVSADFSTLGWPRFSACNSPGLNRGLVASPPIPSGEERLRTLRIVAPAASRRLMWCSLTLRWANRRECGQQHENFVVVGRFRRALAQKRRRPSSLANARAPQSVTNPPYLFLQVTTLYC